MWILYAESGECVNETNIFRTWALLPREISFWNFLTDDKFGCRACANARHAGQESWVWGARIWSMLRDSSPPSRYLYIDLWGCLMRDTDITTTESVMSNWVPVMGWYEALTVKCRACSLASNTNCPCTTPPTHNCSALTAGQQFVINHQSSASIYIPCTVTDAHIISTQLSVWLSGPVVSTLRIRARWPGFESRVASLVHWAASLGKLFTHIASPVSQLQRNWGTKESFSAPKSNVMVIKCARLS